MWRELLGPPVNPAEGRSDPARLPAWPLQPCTRMEFVANNGKDDWVSSEQCTFLGGAPCTAAVCAAQPSGMQGASPPCGLKPSSRVLGRGLGAGRTGWGAHVGSEPARRGGIMLPTSAATHLSRHEGAQLKRCSQGTPRLD